MIRQKTPANPINPLVSEILKRVDTLLKKEDVDSAKTEIEKARQIDPKNMYVHAYFERLQLILEDRTRREEADRSHRQSEIKPPQPSEPVIRVHVDARIKEEEEKAAADRKQRREEEVKRKLNAQSKDQVSRDSAQTRSHADELREYNDALFRAWENGVPDVNAEARLESLRSLLHITNEEHDQLQPSVQRETYSRAFKNLWTSGGAAAQGARTMKALHQSYGITAEKFAGLDLALLAEITPPKASPLLLVLDDDPDVLSTMTALLQNQGYSVVAFTTSDEAYRWLQGSTPDLILADINLESSTMGGFAFFQKLQEIPRIARLPFIFVSGLTDDVVIRTGKSLGADDYITKPFAGDTLLSVIKGKLRRYEELRSVH